MKRSLFCLLGIALLLSLLTGCVGGTPALVSEGGSDGLIEFLTGSGNDEYTLSEDAELDLTGVQISSDKTVWLQEGVTLKLIGAFTPDESCITIRAGFENGGGATIDLSGIAFELAANQEATLFEIRSDVELIPPAESETLVVDTSNDEWTSIKSVIPQLDEPQINEPMEAGPQSDSGISTPEEFLQAFGDPGVNDFELTNDITVELGKAVLDRDLGITCNSHVLTLSGELTMQGGVLSIGEKPGVESGTVDVTELTVACKPDVYTADGSAILFIGLNFKHIIGEPKLGEGLLYEIPDSGEHATVELQEVITPEQHEAKLHEEMTQYLNGDTEAFPGGVGITSEHLADGVLEVRLDNPTISEEIGIPMDGYTKLILTGSVTFDGGNYGFELYDDSTGTATVDITVLEIHGTKALGDTKSPDVFMTRDGVDLIFDESDPHIEVVKNDRFWLRYVQ